jgi:PiT family inorganic phosphate transporter
VSWSDLAFPIVLGLGLIFDFLNGFHDSSNVVATAISSQALPPRLALSLAAVSEFLGPFIFGVAVATTIGKGLLDAKALTIEVLIAGLISAVIWDLVTWYFGIPSSSSHALLGGLLGAGIMEAGPQVVQLPGLMLIILALLASPLAGLLMGFLVMRVTLWLVRGASPKVNRLFRSLQVVTLVGLSLSHGTNDAQKTMGVISLGLLLAGRISSFSVPTWVIAVSAGAIALGTVFGSWRLIRTLGGRIFRIRPIHGFTSQVAGAIVILSAALLGGPVSTTQVLSSTIMGVGAAERLSKVRWGVLRDLAIAWLLTIPLCAAMAALAYLGISLLD